MGELISIVIPVYNVEQYIERCVQSVRNQSYSNIEILLIEDGSTDGSREKVEQLAETDSRIVAVLQDNNMGVSHARITGVRHAKGDWIGFVDGDDVIEPDMYERLYQNSIEYNAQITHCGYQMVFDDGRIRFFYNTGRYVQQDNLTGLKDLLDGSLIEPGLCNKLFHKALFQSLLHEGTMDFSIRNNEDLLMNFILFSCAEKSVFEDFCPYHYIVRKTSASRQKLNKNRIYDPIKVKKRIVELSPKELKNEAEAAYLSTCIDIYNMLVSDRDIDFHQDMNNLRRIILQKKEDAKLLDYRRRVLVKLIAYVPHLYSLMYQIYSKNFQEKKYD